MDSVKYYNENANGFFERTIEADMSDSYAKFTPLLKENAHILDIGCGVGRDSKFFLSKGYQVTAFDASIEMVKMCTKIIQQDVLHMTYREMNFHQEFDAAWACASLLHVPYDDLGDIVKLIYQALKPDAIFYASFKYGTSKMSVKGREFYNLDEKALESYIKDLFKPVDIWESPDITSKVAPSPSKTWLNFIGRKI